MPVDDLAIDLNHVEKRFGRSVHALRGVNMQVHGGEVFGLLGPNGAGKSTLVKIMMTVVHASHATGTILGRRIGHKPTLKRIGYLPEHARFPSYLSGRQVIDFFGAMAKMPRPQRRVRVDQMLELVGAAEYADRKIKTYSKGMQQRIGLAQAMVHDPDLLVLDEPTDGVDPIGRRDIREALTQIRDDGKTVFINSHLLSELEMVCERVAFLVQGQVVKQGRIEDLTFDQVHYQIVLHRPMGVEAIGSALAVEWDGQIGASVTGKTAEGLLLELTDSTLTLRSSDPLDAQPLIDRLRAADMVITDVRSVRPTLEELLLQAVGENGGAS